MASQADGEKQEDAEESFKKIRESYEKFGVEGIQEKLDEYKSTEVNIAVTGQSGSGKSSFINRMRGLKPKDKDAAPVGVTETTTERKCYAFPDNPLIKLWDLPGAGTEAFPIGSYAEDMKFDEYDAFVILTKDRFYENDKKIAETLKDLGKPFFFARSKMDSTIQDQASDQEESFSASATMGAIRDNCRAELGDATQDIYLLAKVDSKKVDAGEEEVTVDFPDNDRLKENIIKCLKGLQRAALGNVHWTFYIKS